MNTQEAQFSAEELIPHNKNNFPNLSPKSISEIEFLGKQTIRQIIREWRWEAREFARKISVLRTAVSAGEIERRDILLRKKRGIDERIKVLLELEKSAKQKPVISSARSGDWVAEGDPVIFYSVPCDGFTPRRTGFLRGILKKDEGEIVTIQFTEKLHDDDCLDGYGVNLRYRSIEILPLADYQYLIAHPEFAQTWVENSYEKHEEKLGLRTRMSCDQFLRDLAMADPNL